MREWLDLKTLSIVGFTIWFIYILDLYILGSFPYSLSLVAPVRLEPLRVTFALASLA